MRNIKEYFSPKGRMARLEYFATMVAISLLMYVPVTIGALAMDSSEAIGLTLMAAGIIVATWSQICVAVKRAHDVNWSGATVLGFFVPIVNIVLGLFLLFKAGTPEGEENKYNA